MNTNPVEVDQPISSTTIEESIVIGGSEDNWIVQSSFATIRAKKAVSCLVHPQIGDRVLSAVLSGGHASILAIVERKSVETTQLKFDGNLDICSSGSISLLANKNMNAISSDNMSLRSKNLSMNTETANLSFDKAAVTGNEAKQCINKIQIVAKYFESVSETSRQVMKNSYRLISGLDSVKATEVIQQIKKRFTVKSHQVSMLAKEDATVNAKRVHLG